LLVLDGEARFNWMHEVKRRKYDKVEGDVRS